MIAFLPLLVSSYLCSRGSVAWGLSATPTLRRGRRGDTCHTTLSMVFEVPLEKVTEQISTQDAVLDRLLDETLRTSARRPVMIQFDPQARSMWKHWRGTVFCETWRPTVRNVLWATLVYSVVFANPRWQTSWTGFHVIWSQILGVTTFTLTFFVNQSYAIWCRILGSCRDLQGGLNNFLMAAAGYAQRQDDVLTGSSDYTAASRNILRLQARYVRLFTILLYASLTRSHRPLLTPLGLRRMVYRGLLTERERVGLKQADVPANARHNVVLMWMFHMLVQASRSSNQATSTPSNPKSNPKLIDGGPGWEERLVAQVQEIRSLANGIEAVLRGRMPFAYAHIVQVLVDTTILLYPFMVFSVNISLPLGLLGTLILTSCYRGLFNLAKQFLDPFHNENFWSGDDALVVDTLIAETNSNSVRWMNCLSNVPLTVKSIQTGELEDYLLPEDGYTVEEAAQIEAEKESLQAADKSPSRLTVELPFSTPQPVVSPTPDRRVTSGAQEGVTTPTEAEATVDELEETVAILNAQPGLDFVPGLDDEGESLLYHKSYGGNATDVASGVEALEIGGVTDADAEEVSFGEDLAEQFWEATDQEWKDLKEGAEGGEGTQTALLP